MIDFEIEVIRRKIRKVMGKHAELERELKGKAGFIFLKMEEVLALGQYRFGSEISSADLTSQFRASRAPVAMAMNLLQAAGYIVIRPQAGAWVIQPSQEEVWAFFRLFANAEAVHTDLAAQRCNPAEVQILSQIQDTIERISPDESSDWVKEELILIGLFHKQVRLMAGTPWLSRQTSSVWPMSNFLMAASGGRSDYDRPSQHKTRRLIIDALLAKDAIRASEAMFKYVIGRGPSSPALHESTGNWHHFTPDSE